MPPHVINTPYGPQLVATESLPPELADLVRSRAIQVPDGGGGAGLPGLAAGALGDAMLGTTPGTSVNIFEDVPSAPPGLVPAAGVPRGLSIRDDAPTPPGRVLVPGAGQFGRPPVEHAPPSHDLPAPMAPPPPTAGGVAGQALGAVAGSLEPSTTIPAQRPSGGVGGLGTIGRLRAAEEQEIRGMQAIGATDAQLGAKTDAALAAEGEQLARGRADFETKAGATREARTEALANLRAAEQARASFQFDPNRLYKNMTTGQRILGAVGLILGSVGAAINKTSNTALQIMDNAAARDMDAQRLEYGKLGDNADAQKNIYAFYRQQGLDDQDAYDAGVKAIHDSTALQLERLKAQATVPQAIANLDVGIARVRQAGIAREQAIMDRAADRAFRREELAIRTIQALGKGRAGKPLSAELTKQLADNDTAGKVIGIMEGEWDNKIGMLSGLSQYIPLTEGSKYVDSRRPAAQVLGRALEGGKLTDADYEAKYVKFFPSPGESKASAANKFRIIRSLLGASQGSLIETAGRAGHNVSGFSDVIQRQNYMPRVARPRGAQ